MKLSIFTTLGGGNYQPTQRQDSLTEALDCYTDLADEVIVVNGSNIGINDGWLSYDGLTKSDGRSETVIKEIFHVWENEFDWRFIGQQFQRGYEACTGDWAVRADLDFIWHEDDFQEIRNFLKNCDAPVACMVKRQFLKHDSYAVKALVPIAFNKKKYGNRIKLDSGEDLCQPSLDGVEINKDEMPVIARRVPVIIDESVTMEQRAKRLPDEMVENGITYAYGEYIPIYNYECLLRTKDVQAKEFFRFARAWGRTFGKNMFNIQSEEDALREFIKMQVGRYKNSNQVKLKLEDHPKFIQETIKNLKPEQFGFNMWGEK